jgi:hypothetical protein
MDGEKEEKRVSPRADEKTMSLSRRTSMSSDYSASLNEFDASSTNTANDVQGIALL